jgi:hypothetical protein
VVREKRPPGLGRRARMPSHVLRDGGLTHDESQLLQLAVDPWGTPEWIGGGQFADQSSHVGRYTGPSGAASTLPGPEQAKATTMPADDGLRFDDVQGRGPVAPRPREPRPERTVCRRQSETWTPRSVDHGELMAECQDLEVQRRARSSEESRRVEERNEDGRHEPSLLDRACILNRHNMYGVSGGTGAQDHRGSSATVDAGARTHRAGADRCGRSVVQGLF